MIEITGLILGILGAIPTVGLSYYWFFKFKPIRRFLSFEDKEALDIVVTTSEITTSAKGSCVLRATTGIGQVQGIAAVSQCLGRFYQNKDVSISFSAQIRKRLDQDIVLLGGLAKNQISALFLEKLAKNYPSLDINFNDNTCSLALGNLRILDGVECDSNNLPIKDIAIVVVSKNLLSSSSSFRRAILCAGFTSYGTGASASWLFEDLLKERMYPIRPEGIPNRNPSCFIAVLEVNLVGGQAVSVHPVQFTALR